ncbi:MAG: hypothetical protein C4528_06900 [Gammaproteobacteria bacterium]|nr:MAG: hypothetical protein C4528_06900 [Gammaproteobacteria bacterium]
MSTPGKEKKPGLIKFRISCRLLLAVVFYAGLAIYIYPHWPGAWQDWAIIVVLSIPFYVLLDWIVGFIFKGKIGENVAQATASFPMLMVGLVIAAGVAGGLLAMWQFVSYIAKTYLDISL